MTTILQISDTHLAADGVLVAGRLATDVTLKQLLNRINVARAHWGSIDAVIVSGDISDDGSYQSYTRFKSLLGALELPVYVIPGNHDVREPMRQVLNQDGYLPDTGHLNWHKRIGHVHLIGLDTLVEGHSHGLLSDDTLHFLQTTLRITNQQPVLLALHHHPFTTGIAFIDRIGLSNTTALADILSHAQGEIRIICGHIHCMVVNCVAGHVAVSSPSPCSGFEWDMRRDAPVGFYDQQDGCLLHRWQDGFQSVRIGPAAGSGPHPFT